MSDRTLSLLERYALVRSQIGFPQCISVVIAYPPVELPSVDILHARLAHLQSVWPHLHARIGNGSTVPAWTPGESWEGCELVSTSPAPGTTLEQVLKEEARIKDRGKALFHVTRYTGEPSFLGITVAHELADGIGSLRLVHAILGVGTLEAEPTPERLEDTINLRPPFITMLGVVFHKLLLPTLPTFISSYFTPETAWPTTVVAASMSCTDNLSLLTFLADFVDTLSNARDRHAPGASIHAVIQTAWTLALASVVGANSITAGTPRSERTGPHCLGNYVSSMSFRFTPYLLQQPLWSLATTLSNCLKSEAAVQSGREAVGMLAYVPQDWEKFWREQAGKPYEDSWELSNLGRTALPNGATDMAWAQPGPIVGCAINVSMLRLDGGLRLSVTWREGCAVTWETVKQVEAAFIQILDCRS